MLELIASMCLHLVSRVRGVALRGSGQVVFYMGCVGVCFHMVCSICFLFCCCVCARRGAAVIAVADLFFR